MPVGIITWGSEVAKAGYSNREGIFALGSLIWRKVFGGRSDIVVTGMPGAGKSVLTHALSEKMVAGYTPPERSVQAEVETLRLRDKRHKIRFHTLPGQDSPQRSEAAEQLFGKGKVDGVIHVVSFGYPSLREEAARQGGPADIEEFRRASLDSELRDFDGLCHEITTYQRKGKGKRLRWLLVVATKLDLYADRNGDAKEHYQGSGPFAHRLTRLQNALGSTNFAFEVKPVSAYPEAFVWNGITVSPQLGLAKRDAYVASLTTTVRSYCGA